jgi:6-phosphogluconolactonase
MTPIHEFATRDALMQAAAERIAFALQFGIDVRQRASAALSGGNTPAPAYSALAALPMDWSKVTFGLVDERFVPSTDAASNEAMVRRTLGPAFDAGAKLVPMFSPNVTPEQAAQYADADYAKMRFDIAVMGMGEDGHTASWFPGMPGLNELLGASNPRSVVAAHYEKAAGSADRLTMTLSSIARSRAVMVLITGAEKRRRLEYALARADAPISALFPTPLMAPVAALISALAPEIWWAP